MDSLKKLRWGFLPFHLAFIFFSSSTVCCQVEGRFFENVLFCAVLFKVTITKEKKEEKKCFGLSFFSPENASVSHLCFRFFVSFITMSVSVIFVSDFLFLL